MAMATAALMALAAGLTAVASIAIYTVRTGISPMPTLPAARRAMLAALPDELTGTVAELGAGWGGLAFAVAGRHPRARIIAYELSPLPWLVLWVRRCVWGLVG